MYTEVPTPDIRIADYDFSGSPYVLQVWGSRNDVQFHKTVDVDSVLNFLWTIGKYEPREQTPVSFFNGPSLRGRSYRCQQIARFLYYQETGKWPAGYNPLEEKPAPGTIAYSAMMAQQYNDHTGYSRNPFL